MNEHALFPRRAIALILACGLLAPVALIGAWFLLRGATPADMAELAVAVAAQAALTAALLSYLLTGQRRRFKELEQSNRELHRREERFRVLVEQSPIAIIEWDAEFRVIEWNEAAEKIFGYPREEALGRHAGFLVADLDSETVGERFRQLTEGSGYSRHVTHNRRSDGSIITCQWIHAHIADESGRTGRLLSSAEDITEKRRAEKARLLSEEKFASAFQCNPDPVSITRVRDNIVMDINQAAEKVTGFTRAEAIGKTPVELGLWVNPKERALLYERLMQEKMVRDFHWTMRTKHGAIRECLINGTTFKIGADDYILTVVRDVTDQRRLEEQKAEADRALLRLAQGTQAVAEESFFELLVADLASALRTDEAFIGLRVEHAPNRIRSIAAHEKGHPMRNFEFVCSGTPWEKVLDGDICVFSADVAAGFPDDPSSAANGWESYAGAPLRDIAGNIIGVLAVLHSRPLGNPDLVRSLLLVFSERASAELERKRAEEELRSSEHRFSAIFQSSPVAMFVVQLDGDHVIKDVNSAFERLFLRNRESVIGKSTLELSLYCKPADRTALIEELRNTGVEHVGREAWMRRGDGGRALVQSSAHAITLDGERFGILACVDITDKRNIENEIRELNATLEQRVVERTEQLQRTNQELAHALETLNKAQEELVRSEKLAALGALVAGVAHELNTPIGNGLMVASALAEQIRTLANAYASSNGLKRSMLESHLSDTAKAADIMTRNLQRAADLVAGFKQVAVDQTSSQRRRFSLAEVVSEIMLTLWPTLKKAAFIIDQNIPADLEMDSYPGPLGQVLTNLVNNALLHGFEGRKTGTVLIAAEATTAGWLQLSVTDDGVGIPPANLNRIFDPFFTTRLGGGGSGLGLNIVHNVVTGILGGRIRVQSEVGVGTTFTLALPLVAPQRQNEDELQKSRLTLA